MTDFPCASAVSGFGERAAGSGSANAPPRVMIAIPALALAAAMAGGGFVDTCRPGRAQNDGSPK